MCGTHLCGVYSISRILRIRGVREVITIGELYSVISKTLKQCKLYTFAERDFVHLSVAKDLAHLHNNKELLARELL